MLRNLSEEEKMIYYHKISSGLKEHIKKYGFWWNGKKHSEETKEKIGKKSSLHQKGEGNSQYGTIWISQNELKISKKIKKNEK